MLPSVFADHPYAPSLTRYLRRPTVQVQVGGLSIGSDAPIRVQSMTTVDTLDTEGSVAEAIRMIEAGCELVRITAPSVKEAQNLKEIREGLRRRGYQTPICADIHFTPNAAELAARLVEKVRINPGNYADKKRFEVIEYTEAEYAAEIERIRGRFLPLLRICREYGTALRVGTNHGSLSDRIMSRYGDTPLGMVESALEFLRFCHDERYDNVVVSMKSSNPQVMVEAYRLLVARLSTEGLPPYPLHLGVTEAGEGEDGRVKSAMGIGTLLEDGLGDTVRVSLTEAPEHEMPVGRALVGRIEDRPAQGLELPELTASPVDPYAYSRRESLEVFNFGHRNVPRVIADFSGSGLSQPEELRAIGHFYLPAIDKWAMNDQGADFVYTGRQPARFMLPNGLKEILDAEVWAAQPEPLRTYPLFSIETYLHCLQNNSLHPVLNFVLVENTLPGGQVLECFRRDPRLVLVVATTHPRPMQALRRLVFALMQARVMLPVVIRWTETQGFDEELTTLRASTDAGGLLLDGLGDGLWLTLPQAEMPSRKKLNSLAFNVLQAARTRISKTEYISCPSCGRTLFDLQETTARIRRRTEHLKGIKIGIMGCIVNGPGEMADADYGYVGMGVNKIALYRGQEVVKRSVHTDNALEELIRLMKEDGVWREPEAMEERLAGEPIGS